MENGDDWFALDKAYHFFFCFFITISFALLAKLSRKSLLRRWNIWFGCLVSLTVGSVKEVADEIGLWNSAGGSVKDAVADLFGTIFASFSLFLGESLNWKKKPDEMARIQDALAV